MSLNKSNPYAKEKQSKKFISLKYLNFDKSNKFNLNWNCLNWVVIWTFAINYNIVIENWFITKNWIINIFSWEIFILNRYWWIISDKNWYFKKNQRWIFVESFEEEKARTTTFNKKWMLSSYNFMLGDGSTLSFNFIDIEIWNKNIIFEHWRVKLLIDNQKLVKKIFKNKKIIILNNLVKKYINFLLKLKNR